MTFSTARFGLAAAEVCAHDGADIGGADTAHLLTVQRAIGDARRALDVLAAEVAGEIHSRAQADPGPGGIARRVGYRNAKDLIADTLGTSGGEVRRLVEVGKTLAAADALLPDAGVTEGIAAGDAPRAWVAVAAAVRASKLTVEKAEIVATALETLKADEELERRFVSLAMRLRPYDLRRVCAREVALADPAGLEERERRLYNARCLDLIERMDGATEVRGLLDPLSASHLRAWLDAQVRAGFQAKRETPGDTRTASQMRVDALATLAHHALGCSDPGSGVKTTLVVRVEDDTLEAKVGAATCESARTPISIGALRAMAVDLQVLPVVMGGKSAPLDVGYAKRCATEYQRAALLERDGGCAWCHAPASHCDAHHIKFWRHRGKTDLNNLVMLCVSCHHRIHYGNWRIEVEEGAVWFTPPPEIDPDQRRRIGGLAHLALDPPEVDERIENVALSEHVA